MYNYVIQHMEIIKQLKGMKRKRTNTVAIKGETTEILNEQTN